MHTGNDVWKHSAIRLIHNILGLAGSADGVCVERDGVGGCCWPVHGRGLRRNI
jgi:hypothetical protein